MDTTFNKFKGDIRTETVKYLADPQLRNIVNVSIALGRPLLVKGEPGTGKTMLAHAIALIIEASNTPKLTLGRLVS